MFQIDHNNIQNTNSISKLFSIAKYCQIAVITQGAPHQLI